MKAALKQKADLFIKNKTAAQKAFKLEYSHMHYLCAYIYADKERELDPDRMKEARKIIRENTKLFSPFKDSASNLAIAATISLDQNPEELFKRTMDVYSILKENKFRPSTFLSAAAVSIASHSEQWDYKNIAKKAADIYREMKGNHPLLTSSEDYGFAVMLAMSEQEIPDMMQSMEDVYALMKGDFFSNNGVQSLSHVLALSEESAGQKRERVLHIYNQLKEKKCKYGTGNELATLGILALLPDATDEMIQDIVDVSDYLKEHKGFGNLALGQAARVMYASCIVASECLNHIEDISLKNTISTTITKSIIAIEMMIIATVAMSASVAATSSSSSS